MVQTRPRLGFDRTEGTSEASVAVSHNFLESRYVVLVKKRGSKTESYLAISDARCGKIFDPRSGAYRRFLPFILCELYTFQPFHSVDILMLLF